ncbi:hypothetical protein BDZ94DRAFT_1316108 [Collybia nuda]|uniref:Uncharacterized protein n=1 Tax=Collybia nuda TaxID=64659 RepID=A0A9P6CAZ9_9AGAR|nr:hypothetical protein BDZ94DRAFT_1316108 [Collybia nuda]
MAGDPGLSHTTLIIVAVCASVAGVVVVYVALQLARSLQRRRTQFVAAPLPPKQPLAHHRAKLEVDRPWFSDPDSLSLSSPMTTEPRLLLPNPSFHDLTPSPSSSESHLSQPTPPSRPRPPRPLSQVSVASSSPSRRHTLRGVPHAPHNQVQIVLPAPLAPGLAPRSRPGSLHRDTDSDRYSVVDKWVPVGRDATSQSPAPSPTRTSRRFSSVPSSYHPPPSSPPPPIPQLPQIFHSSHIPDLEHGPPEQHSRRLHKPCSTLA